MATKMILSIRAAPDRPLETVHSIGSAQSPDPAFPAGPRYVDNEDPEQIIPVPAWDSAEAKHR